MAGLVGSIEAYNPKSDDYSTYKGRLEFYFQINKITDAAMKRAALLTLIGNTGFRMLSDLHFPTKLIDVTYDALVEDLDKAYGRKLSKMASRVRFGTVSQHGGQSIDEFIAELRHASVDCGDQLDNRLNDQLVIGLRSGHIKKKLLEDEDKDLGDILKRARALELVDRKHSSCKSSSHAAAQHVRTSRQPQRNKPYKHPNARGNGASSSNNSCQLLCDRCGKRGHPPERCYFLTQKLTCSKCGRVRHKATVCKSRHPSTSSQPQHKSSDTPRSSSKTLESENCKQRPFTVSKSVSRSLFFSSCARHRVTGCL